MTLVIGLTGPNASGKGEIARYLESRGFGVHSLSDVVRDAAAERGLPPERQHLIEIGNALRRDHGPGVLALRILERLQGRAVVDSIRNPAEVAVLRDALARFVLIGVTAPLDIRFRRSLARARPGDPTTAQEFAERERQENATDPMSQQLDESFRLADHVVDNAGDLDELRSAVDRCLDQLAGE